MGPSHFAFYGAVTTFMDKRAERHKRVLLAIGFVLFLGIASVFVLWLLGLL
jgi:hypothetical protein